MKEKIMEMLNNLSERERTVLTFLITFMMVFMFGGIWFLMDMTVSNRKDTISEQETMIQKMVSMKT
ncbi:MAG TPA: hypothetical protein PLG63_03695, partial [bacterium]|nr:hypothetical protein [bacterium]